MVHGINRTFVVTLEAVLVVLGSLPDAEVLVGFVTGPDQAKYDFFFLYKFRL